MDEHYSPMSLEFLCKEFIKTLLSNDAYFVNNKKFIQELIKLPTPLINSLFHHIGRCGNFTDANLKILYEANTSFGRLELFNVGSLVTPDGLSVFSTCELKEIILHFNRESETLPDSNDLLRSFEGSKQSLKVLKLLSYTISGRHVIDFAANFPNLEVFYLDILTKETFCYDDETWTYLFSECPSLKAIRLFCPNHKSGLWINPMLFCNYGHNLVKVSLPSFLNSNAKIHSLFQLLHLSLLTHLDLSIEYETENDFPVQDFICEESQIQLQDFINSLEDSKIFPNLKSLDLSGWSILLNKNVENIAYAHPMLKFFGLCLLDLQCTKKLSSSNVIKVMNIQVSGSYLEDQIMLSLNLYPERIIYLREALKSLFVICADWKERSPHVIDLVLATLKLHPKDHLLQLAGTACLYNLTKSDSNLRPVSMQQLHEVGELALGSLEKFVSLNRKQIMKNCLLIFCNDRLLHHPQKFPRYAISRICLDCMLEVPESLDRAITRMAVAIVSVLACKITSIETSQLTEAPEMKLLLTIASTRLIEQRIDNTLRFDLSALWNLTDESPKACHLFVEHDGLQLYAELLSAFPEHPIQTKVLGLLNNIAEVEELHVGMLTDGLMQHVRDLIENEEKSVSYFAGGIIANLLFHWKSTYQLLVTSKAELSEKLENAIERWGRLDSEIVTYRSFKPFLGLLECHHLPCIQFFSIWAIHHVCTLNSERYSELMTPECIVRLEYLRSKFKLTAPPKVACIEEIFKACNIHTYVEQ
eukprot:gene3500-3999_t